jgi:hypothetical protein
MKLELLTFPYYYFKYDQIIRNKKINMMQNNIEWQERAFIIQLKERKMPN